FGNRRRQHGRRLRGRRRRAKPAKVHQGQIERVVDRTPFEPSPLAPRRSPEEQARDRDLGFGSVVSRESGQRLLNRDGSFNVIRSGLGFLESFAPYHLLLTASWAGFFGVVIASYV